MGTGVDARTLVVGVPTVLTAILALLLVSTTPAAAAEVSDGAFTGVAKGTCFTASTYICDFDMVAEECIETFVDNHGAAVTTDCDFRVGWGTAGGARTRGNGSSLSCTTSYSTVDPLVQALWNLRTVPTGTVTFTPDVFVNQGSGGAGVATFTARVTTAIYTVFIKGQLGITAGACSSFDRETTHLQGEFVVFAL